MPEFQPVRAPAGEGADARAGGTLACKVCEVDRSLHHFCTVCELGRPSTVGLGTFLRSTIADKAPEGARAYKAIADRLWKQLEAWLRQ